MNVVIHLAVDHNNAHMRMHYKVDGMSEVDNMLNKIQFDVEDFHKDYVINEGKMSFYDRYLKDICSEKEAVWAMWNLCRGCNECPFRDLICNSADTSFEYDLLEDKRW